MIPENSIKKIITAANEGTRYPVMDIVRQQPGLAAVMSKLIPATLPEPYGKNGNREPNVPNVFAFKALSHKTAQSITDAQTTKQLLPDIQLASQILISAILSPKDMMTTELTYTSGLAENKLPAEIHAALVARTRQHFEQVHKIEPLLPKMLDAILFDAGSFAIAVIPENSIDEVINNSANITMESLADHFNMQTGEIRSTNLLGPVKKSTPTPERAGPGLSLENFQVRHRPDEIVARVILEDKAFSRPIEDTYLSVTDNPHLLKIPMINQKMRENRVMDALGSRAFEAMSPKLNDREMTNLIYKNRQFQYRPITVMKTQEQLARHTVGNPLILQLPSESVIPVYVPGRPENQVGFFVLLDADGNPITKSRDADYYQELRTRLTSNDSFPSAMLSKVKGMMGGFDMHDQNHLDFSAKAYGGMIEADLLSRLRNGAYGNGVALARNEEIYRIMLSRALAKQFTQLLFLPIEIMTYMAFSYTDNGIGKSLLEDMKIINSLRSMLMFANTMAGVRNSIGRTRVDIKLDEHDPDPDKTVEMTMHEIVRSRQQYFPLGINSPTDLVDYLQRSGYEFNVTGNPMFPDVAVDFSEKNSNYPKPDVELEDSLRKRSIMSLGLSPQVVDNAFEAQFATSIVTDNLLLAKNALGIQGKFTPFVSDHVRKVAMNSEELGAALTEILNNNFDKLKLGEEKSDSAETTNQSVKNADRQVAREAIIRGFLNEFIMSLEVSLPSPNSATLENQMTAMETYTKALDTCLDAWISDEFLTTETGGDAAQQVDPIKKAIRAHFLRIWMAENGVLTELSQLTAQDAEGKPVIDLFALQAAHNESLTKSLTEFLEHIKKGKDETNKRLEAIGGAGEPPPAATGGSDDGGFGDGFGDGGDDLGGDDLGGLNNPPEQGTPTDETPSVEEPKNEPKPEPEAEPTEEVKATDVADPKKDEVKE